ncbi:hypothetical protein KI387_039328, partial [Taxus chinensis]
HDNHAHKETIVLVDVNSHGRDLSFDVCEESCVKKNEKGITEQHITIKPTTMSDEK